MSSRTLSLNDATYRYMLAHASREAPVLARLREVTAAMPNSMMQISPEQGQFLQLLVRLAGARRCIEVGTFTGYSSLAMALALPADGRLVACDVSAEWTAIAERHWRAAGVAERIELRLAPALDTLAALLAAGEAGRFDLAFLDADKSNYPRYAPLALELLRPGGLLVVDNVLWSGKVADPTIADADTEGIRALNALLHADPRVDLCLLPVADGVTLARKR
jgi:predicted O-methyltransferase YrrM